MENRRAEMRSTFPRCELTVHLRCRHPGASDVLVAARHRGELVHAHDAAIIHTSPSVDKRRNVPSISESRVVANAIHERPATWVRRPR